MTVAISSALQHSSLLRKRSADPDRVAAFMRGDIPTKPARQVVSSPFAKIALRWERRSDRSEEVRRRRMLGGSSGLPDSIRHHYTEGERAALFVIGQQVKRRGFCDLCLNAIADRAGVRRTTVQNAIRRARQLGHVTVRERRRRGAKSLTNIIRVAIADWVRWLKRKADRVRGIGFKEVGTVEKKNTSSTIERPLTSHGQGMEEREAEFVPPGAPLSRRDMQQRHGKGPFGSFSEDAKRSGSGPDVSICEDKFES